jgi:transcriptional antiterminator Rof (Rho-off)
MPNDDLAGKLKTFAAILKFNHDLFEAENFSQAAAMAVNNSRTLLNFRNSVLFEQFSDNSTQLVAQFGQTELHPHTLQVQLFKQLADRFSRQQNEYMVCELKDAADYDETNDENGICICLKLLPPPGAKKRCTLLWLIEYDKELPPFAENTAKLLGKPVSEALNLAKYAESANWKDPVKSRKKWLFAALILLCIGILLLPVRESTTAEFTLKSSQITAAYAWFDGPIAKCLKQDQTPVKKGDVIAVYDISQRRYQYEIALAALNEAKAELELERQNAFSDESKLGKVKLLQKKCEMLAVPVEEAQWYLDHAQIKAPADGILALTDKRAEQLAGKAVRTGDKLFEILARNSLVAEIPVNERDASILQDDFSAVLFLHTAPEKAIAAEISEIASYPTLTAQNTYCYLVRSDLVHSAADDLRFGMRGIAKLTGRKVCLGYMLFKNLILYFRKF